MKNPNPIFNKKEILDFKNLNIKLPKASFLFVTRNRCPSKNPWENPLVWSLLSLESSRIEKIHEYIIINDASRDYTLNTIKWLKKTINTPIRYYSNKTRKGCSLSRNIGIKKVKTELFFMGDDDCIYKPDFVFGSLFTFKYLINKYKNRISVLSLPIYDRDTTYRKTVSYKEIGKTQYQKTWFYHNFDKFPKEYVKNPKYINKINKLYKPIEIDTFTGVTLSSKKTIMEAGSFLDLSMWETDYSEHLELGYTLQKNKYKMFFLPDPRISCIHLKYGVSFNKSHKKYKDIYFSGIGISLEDMFECSNQEMADTGSRVDSCTFHICEIGSFFSFYLKISEALAKKHAIKEYRNFVDKNIVFTDTPQKILSKIKRREIWEKAIKKGIRVTEKQIGQNFNKLYDDILTLIR